MVGNRQVKSRERIRRAMLCAEYDFIELSQSDMRSGDVGDYIDRRISQQGIYGVREVAAYKKQFELLWTRQRSVWVPIAGGGYKKVPHPADIPEFSEAVKKT